MPSTTSSDPLEYLQHYMMLMEIAQAETEIPLEEAEAMVHDVLIASFRHSPENLSQWLTGAMRYAVKHHRAHHE